jgi:AcrR family transcriptional regulator
MNELATLDRPAVGPAEDESAKQRQIIDGARAVFLAKGFDAASMNDIARAAGVSKGTLYVYFKHKEELFEAIVEQECDAQAEGIFDLDPDDHDVEAVLKRLGVAYVKFLCRPEKASAIRTVIAIADRMPEVGRKFYESGPARGIAALADYFSAQVDAGVLSMEDIRIAAAQFMEATHASLFKPIVFNFAPAPSLEQIQRNVAIAVRVFLAAYRA